MVLVSRKYTVVKRLNNRFFDLNERMRLVIRRGQYEFNFWLCELYRIIPIINPSCQVFHPIKQNLLVIFFPKLEKPKHRMLMLK
jgi:hypothetical protein